MTTFEATFTRNAPAASALGSKQYYIAKLATGGVVSLSSAATDKHCGIITTPNSIASGDMINYQHSGSSKVIYGGTVSINDWLTSDSAGKAVATTTNRDVVIGRANIAGVASDIGEVQLNIFTLSVA